MLPRDAGPVNWPRVIAHQPITDVYLLALAVAHAGCLVTLDHGVALAMVLSAEAKHLEHPWRGHHRLPPAMQPASGATCSSASTNASTRIGLVT